MLIWSRNWRRVKLHLRVVALRINIIYTFKNRATSIKTWFKKYVDHKLKKLFGIIKGTKIIFENPSWNCVLPKLWEDILQRFCREFRVLGRKSKGRTTKHIKEDVKIIRSKYRHDSLKVQKFKGHELKAKTTNLKKVLKKTLEKSEILFNVRKWKNELRIDKSETLILYFQYSPLLFLFFFK